MKIVRTIARLNVGGPARHVVWLTKALNNEEFQTSLLTGSVPEGEEDMSYFAEENGVTAFYIPEMSRELSAKDIVSLWKVYRQICLEKPEIIHTHTAKAGFVGRTAGFFYRWLNWKNVKIVHTFHGHVFHSYYGNLKTKLFLFIEKSLARFVTDKIIVITPQQFKEIHHDFGVGKAEQFQIIPLGIDLEKFAASSEKRQILRGEIGAKDDEILIGFVGRLTEIKNVSMLLKVAEMYEKNKVEDLPKLKFVIIGDGNMRESLEKEAENLGLKDKVLFLGNRHDADIFYAGLDIVALVSLNEGTPLSLIEAMANGCAVISTNVGGVVDLLGKIDAEENGFKICERGIRIDSHSAEDFYKGLLRLSQKSDLREKYSKMGKTFTESNYSKSRLIKDISELYRNLRPS